MYADFIIEFRRLSGDLWKITIDISFYKYSYATMAQLAPMTGNWIVNIKDMNYDIYQQYTRKRSHVQQSLSCLQLLDLTDKVTVKVTLIPDYEHWRCRVERLAAPIGRERYL